MKITRLGQRSRREKGNIATEMAVTLPMLLLIAAGIIDLGFLMWEQQVLTNATREGARAAARAVGGGTFELTRLQVMNQVVQPYLTNYKIKNDGGAPINLTLGGTYNYAVDATATPNRITISLVNIPVRLMLLPNIQRLFAGGTFTQTVNLNAQTTMAAEWTAAPP